MRAWSAIADIGAFTFPGVMPAYVSIEVMLLGVAGDPDPLLPQEAVEKLVFIAGAVREFAELLLQARGEWDEAVERYVAERSVPRSKGTR